MSVTGRVDITANFPGSTGGPLTNVVTMLIPNVASPNIAMGGQFAVGVGNLFLPPGADTVLIVPDPLNAGTMRLAATFWVGTNGPTLFTLPQGHGPLLAYTVPSGPPFRVLATVFF